MTKILVVSCCVDNVYIYGVFHELDVFSAGNIR